MSLSRLLNTAAIRLALRYAIYYALLIGLGLSVLYWAHSRFVDTQITASLEYELSVLKQIDLIQGRKRLLQIINNRLDVATENRHYLLLVSPSGEKLAGDLKAWPPKLLTNHQVSNIWIRDKQILPNPTKPYDYWPMIATKLPDGSRLLVAHGVQQAVALQEFMLSAMVILLIVIVGMTLLLGWRMGNQMLERVDTINNTARHILLGDFSSRINTSERNDEFDEIVTQLNKMLDHVERLIKGMREVTDNIAHDLRHPLTRLRNRLEVTLLEARDKSEYRETLERAVIETDNMIRTFNALLEIAQAESGTYRGKWEEINLSELSRDVGELYQGSAEDNDQTLCIQTHPKVYIQGKRHLLAQAISNLLENAIKYSDKGSQITLQTLRPDKSSVMLIVSDTGPGVPASEYQHIQQRFVRLDKDRSTPGNGLGLSLVTAACELHNATLIMKDNHPGLRVEMTFKTLET